MGERIEGVVALLRHRWAKIALEAAAIVLLCWLVGRLSDIITPLLIGLVAAYTLDPVVTWLTRRGLTRVVSVTLVFGVFVLGALAALAWGVPKAWHETRLFYAEALIGDAYQDLNGDGKWEQGEPLTRDLYQDGIYHEAWLKRLHRAMVQKGLIEASAKHDREEEGVEGAPSATSAATAGGNAAADTIVANELSYDFDPISWAKEHLRGMVIAYSKGDHHVADKILVILKRVGFYLTAAILIPIYAYFFSLNLPQISRTILDHVPPAHRMRTLRIFAEINQSVGAFFRGRVLICAILAVVASTGFAFGHVPSWMVLGLLMGCATAIPMASILLLIPACFLLFLSSAEPWQYWVACLTWLTVQGLEHVLLLIIMGKGVELHPVLIIVAILGFGSLFGAPGVLLAVPLAATLRILVREFGYPSLRQMVGLAPAQGPAQEQPQPPGPAAAP